MISISLYCLAVFVLGRAILALKNYIVRRREIARFATENKCLPLPHLPQLDPILGIGHFFTNAMTFQRKEFLTQRIKDHNTYGSTFAFTELGGSYIVTRDPENIKAAFTADIDTCGIEEFRAVPMAPLLQQSLFIHDGPIQKKSRDDIKPMLARSGYNDLNLVEKYFQKLVSVLPKDGTTVDFQALIGRVNQDFISEYAFGVSLNSADDEGSVVNKALRTALAGISDRTMLGGALGSALSYVPISKDFASACQTMHNFIDRAIDNARAANASKEVVGGPKVSTEEMNTTADESFIQQVVRKSSDKEYLRSLVLTVFIAGADTGSAVFSNVLMCLSRHPEVQSKVIEEIRMLEGKTPSFEQLQKMTYLKAVIDETQRLFSIAPVTIRMAKRDFCLPRGGGPDGDAPAFVAKGTGVWLSLDAMHHDPANYGSNVEIFRPERWLEQKHDPWAFIPFGGGPRICPGQYMATTNLLYMLTRLFQHFKAVESRDDRPYVPNAAVAWVNANGTRIGFLPRTREA